MSIFKMLFWISWLKKLVVSWGEVVGFLIKSEEIIWKTFLGWLVE